MQKVTLTEIRRKLEERLLPAELVIENESHKHAGHAGRAGKSDEDVTHVRISAIASAFNGMSRPARHRLVYDLLADELQSGLHALALTCSTPAEAERYSG